MKDYWYNGQYIDRPAETEEEKLQREEWERTEFPKLQIFDLKAQLQATDYKALKYFEGWLSDEEYAPIKAKRQAIRDKINELEQSE